MGLLSFLKRKPDPAHEAPAAAAPDAVAAARTRARRRLIGAAVLLGIGVIGFPLLFETQPRPIPVNIPIEIPGRDSSPPLALPSATPALTPAPAALVAGAEPAQAGAPAAPEIIEKLSPPTRESAPTVPPEAAAKPKPDAEAQAAKPPPAPVPASKPADDGARARALLSGQAGAEASARVVVQVGAYSEAAKLRDVRQKVEKLGFKTYTQVVDADGVKQTRVRVGPFDSRAEADKVAARIKASGLPVAVYTL